MTANLTGRIEDVGALVRHAVRSPLGGLLVVANAIGLLAVLGLESVPSCIHLTCTTVETAGYSLVGPVRSPLAALLLLANAPAWAAMYFAEWLAQPWWGGLCVARAAAFERAFLVLAGAAHAALCGRLLEAWAAARRLEVHRGSLAAVEHAQLPQTLPKAPRPEGTRLRR